MEKSNKGTWKLVIIKQNDREPRLFQEEEREVLRRRSVLHLRNTPYKTTGQFPAELQVGKGLPTLLDRTKPHLSIKRDIEIWKQKIKRKHADQLTKRNGAMDEPNQSEENDTSSSCKRYIPEKWQNYIILPTQKKVGNLKNLQIILKICLHYKWHDITRYHYFLVLTAMNGQLSLSSLRSNLTVMMAVTKVLLVVS
ncbi:hypothetical protein T06_518, partial [Trichinella sp. T6]